MRCLACNTEAGFTPSGLCSMCTDKRADGMALPGHCWRCNRILVTAGEKNRDICFACTSQIQPISEPEFKEMMRGTH